MRKRTRVINPWINMGPCLLAWGLCAASPRPYALEGSNPLGSPHHNAPCMQSEDDSNTPSPISDPRKLGYHLTFHDEFNGTHLDTSKWNDCYPGGDRTHYNANGEQEYYAPDGYRVHNGHLDLIAERRSMGGKPYTSGMICSYGKFSQMYGWFEIRAKFPKGKGLWPAFWLLPADNSWPPEIDVLEILGHQLNKVYMTNHYVGESPDHTGDSGSFVGPDFSAGYHTFALQWTPTSLTWYVDGIPRFHTEKYIPHVPMYILANLAVGGHWPGYPDQSTQFPAVMSIDYIRVYQK